MRTGFGARVFTISIVVACVTLCTAQVPINATGDLVKTLHDNNIIHGDIQNPLLPTGSSSPPAKNVTDLADLGQGNDFILKHADHQKRNGDQVALTGNVLFLVQGYRVTCDKAIGNLHSQIFTLQGDVRVDGEKFNITKAGTVTIDFPYKTYHSFDAETQVSPQLVKGRLKDNLYVKGHESYGSQKQFTTLDGRLTTCPNLVPHYEIDAASIVVQPGKRAIFRKTKIIILGYKVLEIPFLVIPLENRTYKYMPYVGQTPDEGYFAKWRIGIPLKNPNYNLLTSEDFMSKLGVGLGATYEHQAHDFAGTETVYHVFGKGGDLSVNLSERKAFSWGTFSLDTDYEKDNHLVNPGSTQLSNRFALNLPQGQRGSDRISFSQSSNTSSGYQTSNRTISLNDVKDFGDRFQTQFDLNYFSSSSTFQSSGSSSTTQETQRMDVHFQAQKDLNSALATIEYQRSIPIGNTATSIGGSDQTPVLSLQSDARRLLGPKIGQGFPFQTTLSWGDFQDPQSNSHISRGFFDFNFNKIDSSRSPLKVDLNGDFKQGIYSDDTAEYVLTFGTNVRYDLGPDTGLNLRYNYLRPYGYSPLSIDQTGQTNFLSGDLNYRPIRAFLIGAQTGYDILRLKQKEVAWQQIGIRTEYQPEKWFLLRGLYTYDTFDRVWQSVRLDLTYVPGATKLSVGTVYDGLQHTWSSLSVFLDNFHWGKMRISAALSYNGYLKQFDSEQYNVIYDLHCAEAVFSLQQNNSGFRSGRQMQFFVRLKALPFDVPFGVGTRGQPVGFGNGSSF